MIARIGRRRTFVELRRRGRRARHGSVRLIHLAADNPVPEVAFAIGRSFGNAVERNRGRRRLRSAFVDALSRRSRSTGAATPPGAYLLSGGRGLLTDPYPRLVGDVEACLDAVTTPVP